MQNPSVSSGSEATAVPGSRHEHPKPPSARGWTAETTQEPRYPHEVQDPRPVSSTSATVRAHRCRTTAIHSLIVHTASNAFRLLPGSSMLHFAVVPVADTAWFDLTYCTLLLAAGIRVRKTILAAWLALVEARYESAFNHKSRRPSPVAICHRVPATHLAQRKWKGDRRRHSTLPTSQSDGGDLDCR